MRYIKFVIIIISLLFIQATELRELSHEYTITHKVKKESLIITIIKKSTYDKINKIKDEEKVVGKKIELKPEINKSLDIVVNNKVFESIETNKKGMIKLDLNKLVDFCLMHKDFTIEIRNAGKHIINIAEYPEVHKREEYKSFAGDVDKEKEKISKILDGYNALKYKDSRSVDRDISIIDKLKHNKPGEVIRIIDIKIVEMKQLSEKLKKLEFENDQKNVLKALSLERYKPETYKPENTYMLGQVNILLNNWKNNLKKYEKYPEVVKQLNNKIEVFETRKTEIQIGVDKLKEEAERVKAERDAKRIEQCRDRCNNNYDQCAWQSLRYDEYREVLYRQKCEEIRNKCLDSCK